LSYINKPRLFMIGRVVTNRSTCATMIFSLVEDFAATLDAMTREHPRRRTLELFLKAIRRDVHFIDRHPTTMFQCMWNTCWWFSLCDFLG